jgi:hypothetical protein
MEFLNAIMDLTFAQLFVAGAVLLVIFGSPSVSTDEEDDNSDYENATWNPGSVNYKE